jgi:glutathione synthase/RimK-type ligase-like ATP-grasp enzyme
VILLWGVPGDGPFDEVRTALERIDGDAVILDQRQGQRLRAIFASEVSDVPFARLVGGDHEVDLAEISAAYIRPFETAKVCEDRNHDSAAMQRAERIDSVLVAWADLADAHIVNRPAAMAANNSKPFQQALIAASGFAVPDTLVTTDPDAVNEFCRRHHAVIYKSISGVRSIVSRVGDLRVQAIADVANCPTQFQEYIAGVDVRVHVIGGMSLSTEIRSSGDDYRYATRSGADLRMTATELPEDIAQRCRTMVRRMGLLFAGIDLRRTPEGAWYCFEVNPSPGFSFFEAATGQPIAAAVAAMLVELDQCDGERTGFGL